MPETPFLYYTSQEINNFLDAQRDLQKLLTSTIDRAGRSSKGLLLLGGILPSALCLKLEIRDLGKRIKKTNHLNIESSLKVIQA